MDNDAVNYGPDYAPEEGAELLYDSAGTPVTAQYLDTLADEFKGSDEALPAGTTVEFHVSGRPSLTAPGGTSPTVHFRVPERLRATVEHRAETEGKSVSALAREALERYVSEATG
jgi:hypothetical protein